MIDKYKQGFQEEAREILVELESALLALNESRDDTELIGRAFRALHTIKGSGAMFGFEEIAAFTHHIENAFEQVRSGRLSATSDLISLALTAADQIKAMLDEAAGHGSADAAASAQILNKLRELTGVGEPPPVKKAAAAPAACSPAAAGEPRTWRLRFCPKPDLLGNGAGSTAAVPRAAATGKTYRSKGGHLRSSSARRTGSGALLYRLGHGP